MKPPSQGPLPGPNGPASQPRRKRETPAKVLLAVVALFGLIALSATFCVNVGFKSFAAKKAADEKRHAFARQHASPLVLADLLAAYQDDKAKADQQYKGRLALMSGDAVVVKTDAQNNLDLTLGAGTSPESPRFTCRLSDDQRAKALRLAKGQHVTVVGQIEGWVGDLRLRDCEIQ